MRSLFFILIFLFQNNAFAQGIDFFHGTWEEALVKAAEEEKIIFVDAYASWCGPCKRMAKATFPNEKVGDFFNKNFLNVKLDYEKKEAASFRKKYPVSAFPTLYFIDYDGSVVHVQKGAQNVDGIIGVGKMVVAKIDRSGTFKIAYDEGDKSPETVYRYIKALNQADKSSLTIVNDYLSHQEDLSTPENLKIIYEGATEADSRVFDLLIRYRKPITKLVGPEAVNKKIRTACRNTVLKASEFEIESLLEEAISKMKEHGSEVKRFEVESDMLYTQSTGNIKEYLNACKKYRKKYIKDNAAELHRLAKEMSQNFPMDKSIQKEVQKISKKIEKLKQLSPESK